MQERHLNRYQYFLEQGRTTSKFVIPYMERAVAVKQGTRVLEIGCGECGNMTPFVERGCEVVGVDLNGPQLERGAGYLEKATGRTDIQLIHKDIYVVPKDEIGTFDIIMMRDVIEHIHNQERFMAFLEQLLRPDGIVFFGFPPWRMPFGGHQQVCRSKLLSKLPYFHLLPMPLYKAVLRLAGEHPSTVDSLAEIKETGISIARFEGIVKSENYRWLEKDYYFINPNYETKFGLKPRKLSGLVGAIPYVKDFFCTCVYCIIRK